MITAGDFKKGITVEWDGGVWTIVDFQHVKPGKGAAFVRTKIKNVMTGAVVERSFNPTDKMPKAIIETKEMQYVYNDGELYYFMDVETYDQIPMSLDKVEDAIPYVKEGTNVTVRFFKGQPFSVEAPNFVVLEVTDTEPGFKGDTASNTYKPATLETGYSCRCRCSSTRATRFVLTPAPASTWSAHNYLTISSNRLGGQTSSEPIVIQTKPSLGGLDMSKLTDKVSYLKGLAAGMKLNMEKDSNKLLLEILGAMGDMAEEMQRMDEAHRELQDYVESIDDDLSDLTETLFSDEEEDDEDADDADECDCEDCADDTDDEDDAAEEENPDDDLIAYACPNCGAELTFHANDVDFDENTLCPNCHQPIFPEIDEDSEEETEE